MGSSFSTFLVEKSKITLEKIECHPTLPLWQEVLSVKKLLLSWKHKTVPPLWYKQPGFAPQPTFRSLCWVMLPPPKNCFLPRKPFKTFYPGIEDCMRAARISDQRPITIIWCDSCCTGNQCNGGNDSASVFDLLSFHLRCRIFRALSVGNQFWMTTSLLGFLAIGRTEYK